MKFVDAKEFYACPLNQSRGIPEARRSVIGDGGKRIPHSQGARPGIVRTRFFKGEFGGEVGRRGEKKYGER